MRFLPDIGTWVDGVAFGKTTPHCLKGIRGTLGSASTISADDEPSRNCFPLFVFCGVFTVHVTNSANMGTTSVDLVASLDLLAEMEAHPMLELSLKKMRFTDIVWNGTYFNVYPFFRV